MAAASLSSGLACSMLLLFTVTRTASSQNESENGLNQTDDYTASMSQGLACSRIIINFIVQEQCESRGGRPELSVLTSLQVSVDVKNY